MINYKTEQTIAQNSTLMDTQLFDIDVKLPIVRLENGINGIGDLDLTINIDSNDCNNNKDQQQQQQLDLPKPSFRLANNAEYGRTRLYAGRRSKESIPNSIYKRPKSKSKSKQPKLQVKLDTNYYHHTEPTAEELMNKVEYDMDDEDFNWLENFNKQIQEKYHHTVTEDDFEKVMDRLEKESYFESQLSGKEVVPEVDEDAVCAICDDGKCDNTNVILFCDMCDLPVHQECYGVPYIPEGQWLCRRCLQSPSRNVDCVLCPNKGGAFKQTDDGRWAHVMCALWVPEVCFANAVFLEPIDSIDRIPAARWKLCCYICKQKKVGACIQCHKPNCYAPFHVTCARQAGLYLKIKTHRYPTPDGALIDVKKEAFCDVHNPTNAHKGGGMYTDDETDIEEEETTAYKKWKRAKKEKLKNTRKILAEKRAIAFNPIANPVVNEDKLTDISKLITLRGKRGPAAQLDEFRKMFIATIKGYWLLKRERRNGVPLLRRLQVSFTKKSSEPVGLSGDDLDQELYMRLRYDLEKARLLVGEVKKRELMKKRLFKLSKEIVDLNYRVIDNEHPITDVIKKETLFKS